MLLSGYNFSRFNLSNRDPQKIVPSIFRLMWEMVWPPMVILILVFSLRREFSWSEFFFISHWFKADSLFGPLLIYWYIQVLLQILAALALLYALPGVGQSLVRYPYFAAPTVLLVGLCLFVVCHMIWDTRNLNDWLPHLCLWNFALGWFIQASAEKASQKKARIYKFVALAVTIISSLIGYWGKPVSISLLITGCILICWWPKVSFPKPLARQIMLLGQASFTIYLLHAFGPLISRHTIVKWCHIDSPLLDGLLSISACTLLWMMATAAVRAYNALKAEAVLTA